MNARKQYGMPSNMRGKATKLMHGVTITSNQSPKYDFKSLLINFEFLRDIAIQNSWFFGFNNTSITIKSDKEYDNIITRKNFVSWNNKGTTRRQVSQMLLANLFFFFNLSVVTTLALAKYLTGQHHVHTELKQ